MSSSPPRAIEFPLSRKWRSWRCSCSQKREADLLPLFQFNLLNVNLVNFGIQNPGDHHSLSFEAVHLIGPVEAVNVVPGRQDEIPSQALDAINRAGIRGPAHRFRLEHFLMRARERVNVQGTLAVGNFSVKLARGLCMGDAGRRQHADSPENDDSIKHGLKSGWTHRNLTLRHGSTVNFMCMPS